MTSSYSMNLKTGAKAKVLKAQIDAVFTSAKLAEARAARIKMFQIISFPNRAP